ncbi:putative MraZ protein [Sphingobium sp. ba1]|jgi:MraZ protein|nr:MULTISPECIES: division/cell wall cluster transcriptional repressor MraZ [unclassified Sphingobium]KFL48520.1 putative MraZ protein [Sphingobium sp. ba1]|tara:strand:+ start:3475 stop:3996 length:522 start_codon:yes stop_codon:yes gene_type:complete
MEKGPLVAVSDAILYSGNAISVADGKGRFVLPLEMRKQVKQASGGENRLCLSIHMANGCATGFGLSHKQFLFDEVAELERLAREANRPFNGDLERENRLSMIEDVNFDDGGRFFLHPDIKEEVGITDAVVFLGVGLYFQLWDPKALVASPDRPAVIRNKAKRWLDARAAEGGK